MVVARWKRPSLVAAEASVPRLLFRPDFEAFKVWWHRVGKQGKDLTCKADADKAYEAYEAFKADKTKPK